MKKYLLLTSVTFLIAFVHSQTAQLGKPYGFNENFVLTKKVYKLPELDNSTLEKKYKNDLNTAETKILQYGEAINLSLDFFSLAEKQVVNNTTIYHILLQSKNAVSLNVIFEKFKLEEGTLLYLFDQTKSKYVGAYTSLNNNLSEKLGTELIYSDKIYIEVVEPIQNLNKSKLSIGDVIHGFTNLDNQVDKLLNQAGGCHIDVNCPQGSGWEIPRNGVVMLVNSTGGFCTGSMINTTSGPIKPYLLTANHCGQDPSAWIFKFRWEAPENATNCAANTPSGNGPENMNINGATTRAKYSVSDFHLIELNSAPLQTWDVSYNGWDRTDNLSISGAGIHHPLGDIKKIAISNEQIDSAAYSTSIVKNHWKSSWSEGVTESGSSGSPLFNQFRRIIGQLHGGASSCGSNDLSDFYGKFSVSWNGGNTPATRLKDWLDPTNTGFEFIDANVTNNLDAFFTSQINGVERTICTGLISPSIILCNGGSNILNTATINVKIDGVDNIINWTGSLGLFQIDTLYLGSFNLTAGTHNIIVIIVNANNGIDDNPNNNSSSMNFSVVLGGEKLIFEINLDCFANETSWKIVDNNNVTFYSIENYVKEEFGYTVKHNLCLNDDCYDLIVEDKWTDGLSSSGCEPGSFYLYTEQSDTLISLNPADANFGSAYIKNFCVGTSSILENDMQANLKVFPNPIETSLNIISSETIYEIKIIDLSGKIVFINENTNSKEYYIDLNLEKGLYTLILKTKNRFLTQKLYK